MSTLTQKFVMGRARSERSKPRVKFVARFGGVEGLIGLSLIVLLVLVAIFAPLIAPHSPNQIVGDQVLAPPSLAHPFGSDDLGRDVLSRVLYAYRVTLSIALGSVALACAVGIPLGLIVGYASGWADLLLMRAIDLLLSFPAMLLAISLIAILGQGTGIALIAIAVIYTPIITRVVRSSALVVSRMPYVTGARARGVSHFRIVIGHVLPNSIGPALVQASVLMAFAVMVEAALSFLGLGSQPPTPELGLMLAEANGYVSQAPWVEIFPGLAIAVTVLSFNLVGDALRRLFAAPGGS